MQCQCKPAGPNAQAAQCLSSLGDPPNTYWFPSHPGPTSLLPSCSTSVFSQAWVKKRCREAQCCARGQHAPRLMPQQFRGDSRVRDSRNSQPRSEQPKRVREATLQEERRDENNAQYSSCCGAGRAAETEVSLVWCLAEVALGDGHLQAGLCKP